MIPILSINNLEKQYEGRVNTAALRGVSFAVMPGEFMAIMGPSGSGKSTLLHILGFLDKQSGGTYRFGGRLNTEYDEVEMAKLRNKKVGFIFQSFNLLSRSSVLENVLLPLQYSDVPPAEWEDKARQAVEAVGLSHRLHHQPSELSGGEKQRVAIARALVNNPSVIFADEPTGNLDSESGKNVMQILQELNQKRGHTIILITHETYTAQHADRILYIKDGRLEREERVQAQRQAETQFIK
ncbi:MAG: ABC transporter ATP-binding protein [Candidatus Peregrinibacteria bacterium]